MRELRQNTTRITQIGPANYVSGDWTVPATVLSATGVDSLGVFKDEATGMSSIVSTCNLTHMTGGMFHVTFVTGDVDTLGQLQFYLRDDDACLPIWHEFEVVSQSYYDAKYGSDFMATVKTQVVEALTGDTYSELPQGAPPNPASFLDMERWKYKLSRNKVDNDGSNILVYSDSGATADQKAPVSEADGTVTRGEFTSGP